MWGGSIKIGARPFWGRGVFVLVISNIYIGFQKLLTLPLMFLIVCLFVSMSLIERMQNVTSSTALELCFLILYVVQYTDRLILNLLFRL